MDKLDSIIKDLKNIKADETWVSSNREILCTQITNSGAENLSAGRKRWLNFKCFVQTTARPVFALELAVVVLLFSIFAHQLLSEIKPNDSLYTAKVFSEKTYLNTIRNNETRDKVVAQFATKHAKDIILLLADPEFNTEANSKQVEKLNQSFEREIETVASTVSNKIAKHNAKNNPQEDRKASSSALSTSSEPLAELEEELIYIASEEDLITEEGIELSVKEEEVETNSDSALSNDIKTLILQKEFEHAMLKLEELEQSLE